MGNRQKAWTLAGKFWYNFSSDRQRRVRMQKRHHRIAALNTIYARRIAENRRYRYRVHVRRAKIMYFIILVVALILGFQLWQSKQTLAKVNQNIDQQRTVLNQKQATGKKLTKQISLLHNQDYLEQLIRSKYNYSKTGETIYNFAD
ncbi:septum formation initiator [Limosilactobacillus fermentum]|nr:septum formation initiator [Limosilactobacillus fermentum]